MAMRTSTRSVEHREPRLSYSQRRMIEERASMNNTTILTPSELMRIKDECILDKTQVIESKVAEKLTLKEISKERVKNWPNTLQAMRKRKDVSRFERFMEEEERRRKIDAEEAEFQANARRKTLENANRLIFESNDRVKAFQSKMLLVDALQERELQLEIIKRKREIEKETAADHHEDVLRRIATEEEREQEKFKQGIEKNKQLKAMLGTQLDDMKRKHVEALRRHQLEGQIIKQRAEEGLAQEKEEARARRMKLLAAQEDMRKENEHLKELKAIEKAHEKEEEARIEEFSQKKEQMMEYRKQCLDTRFNEKQTIRQKLIDAQSERLSKIKRNEEEKVEREVQEKMVRDENIAKAKQERRDELVKNIEKYRAMSVQRRAEDTAKEKEIERSFQEHWKKKNKEMEELEKRRASDYKDQCKFLASIWQKEVSSKHKKIEIDFLKELADAEKIKNGLVEEEKQFNSWAEKCLNEWEGTGKNIKPLLQELTQYKKKVH